MCTDRRSDFPVQAVRCDRATPLGRSSLAARIITLALLMVLIRDGGGHASTAADDGNDRPAVNSDQCIVQPRRDQDLVTLALAPQGIAHALLSEQPVPTPEPPGPGEPANPELVASVNATARQLVACYNAGDLRRLFSLYSEAYLFTVWGGFAGPNPDRQQVADAIAFISKPVPQPDDNQLGLRSVQDVQELPDGRVMAVINLSDASLLTLFRYSDGWYQVDWAYPLPQKEAWPWLSASSEPYWKIES
jgi:hypothetical protein